MSTKSPDRLPPSAPEAEQGVLGCILLDPVQSMPICIERFKDGGKEFYDLRHQLIYSALIEMHDAAEPIDIITLQQHLKDRKLLDRVSGVAYLSTLPDCVPSALNLGYYLEIVTDKYLLRKMLRVCTEVAGRVFDYEGEVDDLIDKAEADILQVSDSRISTQAKGIKQLVRGALDTIETLHQNQGALTGVETGLIDLDKMTRGFQPGDMIVIAARPSMGKTSIAMGIAEHVAVDSQLPVGVFSLEMTAEALTLRMICSRARLNIRSINDGFLTEGDFKKLGGVAGRMANAPLYIDDTGGLSIIQLRSKARRMHQQYGVKLFVVDYIQLLHSTARRAENRQQEIADISSGLKALAKELKVPVIVLSQLNRELEKDKSRKPRLSDLRESGAIEQDADIVGLLYKPKSGDEDDPQGDYSESIPVNLLIAKQRNGPTGDVNLTFFKPYTRFENAAKIDPEVRQPHND